MNLANNTNRKLTGLARPYVATLRNYLKRGRKAGGRAAQGLGRRAMGLGLETLDLARIHEQALITLVLPHSSTSSRESMARRAGTFFAEVITPIEQTHRIAREATVHLNKMIETLHRRSVELAASNRLLKVEITQRKTVEAALRKSEHHHGTLLAQSRRLQEQLRHLSRQILSAQEEERKMISRELHDEVAQTLTGINVQLAALKTQSTINTKDLQKKITRTQRMVEKSVDIVHRFARDLRPTVLDDLGLIPALNSFAKSFAKRTHLRIRLTVFAAVEQLDNAKRTVLYRVAQEALTNVAKHAQATGVDIRIEKLSNTACLSIKDNGKSFRVQQMLHTRRNNRLGLLGMRERVEMVGGSFTVESSPGHGTTVRAELPLNNGSRWRTTHPKRALAGTHF
jgi:signal transduction histidine kinase